MNAIVNPSYVRLITKLVNDVEFGAPLDLLTLEADECPKLIDEESKYRVAHVMQAAVTGLLSKNEGTRLDALIRKMMLGTMTADELLDYRDLHRAALMDHCSVWARRRVQEELGL